MWEMFFGIGTLLLLAAMVYGVMQNNRRNRANDPVTAEATKQLYNDPAGYTDQKRNEFAEKVR